MDWNGTPYRRVLKMSSGLSAEEFDKRLEDWHESESNLEFHEYLGWTWEEYKIYYDTVVRCNT